MTTVTEKNTKADILEAYNLLSIEHATLQQTVVDVALAKAKRHGWCDVVKQSLKDMGLGHLLPPVYIVQEKRTDRGRYGNGDEYDNEKAARSAAKESRKYAVQSARWDHDREHNNYRSVDNSERLHFTIDANTNIDQIKTTVDEAFNRAKATVKPKAPKFEAPKYPIYRVVRKDSDGTVTVLD
jgi:hypothetical protein